MDDGHVTYTLRIKRFFRRVANKDKPDANDIEEERVLDREKRRIDIADAQETIAAARDTRTNRRIVLIFVLVFLTIVTSVCLCIVILSGMKVIDVSDKVLVTLLVSLVGSAIGVFLVITKGLYPPTPGSGK